MGEILPPYFYRLTRGRQITEARLVSRHNFPALDGQTAEIVSTKQYPTSPRYLRNAMCYRYVPLLAVQ
jgi:hypothetical protein